MIENIKTDILEGDCEEILGKQSFSPFDLTYLDPPFNQGKEYRAHDDHMDDDAYWTWMRRICTLIFAHTNAGGAIYFMQREKNAHHVMSVLEASGWCFQNLIIWKKKTSAVPCSNKFGKHYQIIVFATKGEKPGIFNKLRIDPPLLVTEKNARPNGMFVTDVWDDIRELTSGYFAGEEPLRFENGERMHKQQSPVELLTRIILSSTKIGNVVFDPFAGTGTTLVVAKQLGRSSIGIDIDTLNISSIKERLSSFRKSDQVDRFRKDYICTENIDEIWPVTQYEEFYNRQQKMCHQRSLFE